MQAEYSHPEFLRATFYDPQPSPQGRRHNLQRKPLGYRCGIVFDCPRVLRSDAASVAGGLGYSNTRARWFGGFWLIATALIVVPLGAKLEVGDNYIQTSLFGFPTMRKLERRDVAGIRYENMTAWGISTGKGIKIWKRHTNDSWSSVKPTWAFDASVAESIHGKEAVEHAKQALSNAS